MEKNVSLTRKLVLTGALSALIIVLGITKLGLIPLGPAASITILHRNKGEKFRCEQTRVH